jgi:alpha-L-fucosidase
MDIYDMSVGRGANMLINIGPDRRGKLPECDSKALIAMGNAVKAREAKPFATLADFEIQEDGNSWICYNQRGAYSPCNLIVIQEDLTDGQAAKRFSIDINGFEKGRYVSMHQGCTIGHKQIIRLPEFHASTIRLRIIESDGPVKLRSLNLHHV